MCEGGGMKVKEGEMTGSGKCWQIGGGLMKNG